jgi:hypothetical protein
MADTYLIYRIDAQGQKRILHSVDTEEKAKLGVSRCETAPERRFDNFYGWELKPSTPRLNDAPSVNACVGCRFNIGENATECIEPTASQMIPCLTFVCACVWRQTSRDTTCAHCSCDMSKQKMHERCSHGGLCESITDYDQRTLSAMKQSLAHPFNGFEPPPSSNVQ